ncbi:hypothetical protein BKA63DRAFT_520787 [Paraphoma chrysanthemicola]|nr:hypothetical protein BKA63DRAFT_520787 [Paraphoma chrysanthemicola]
MPYNNTPIAPSKEVTGHVSLPLARVQKIIHADPQRINVSKNAAFAIALATEMFIQHLATTTHNVVKAERKPRRNIQYRDVSSAIAKTDNLEFAVDVVPRTITFKEAKKRKEEREEREKKEEGKKKEKENIWEGNGAEEPAAVNGHVNGNANGVEKKINGTTAEQPATNGSATPASASAPAPAPPKPEDTADAMEVDAQPERVEDSEPEEDPAAMQLEMEMRGPPRPVPSVSPEARRSTGGFTSINGAK